MFELTPNEVGVDWKLLDVRDFDFLPGRADGAIRVVLASTEKLLVCELVPSGDSLHGRVKILSKDRFSKAKKPVSVRVADFTGDGVPDVAVGTKNGLVQVFRQKAVLP